MAGEGAIREDVQVEGVDAATQVDKPVVKEDDYNPRRAHMDSILKRHKETVDAEVGTGGGPGVTNDAATADPVDETVTDTVAPQADLDAATQISLQGDGDIVLTPEQMKRVRFTTKVDGKESVVDGSKLLSTFQKNEAADVRLQRAAEKERQAEEILSKAKKAQQEATTKAEAEVAAKAVEEAYAGLDAILSDATDSLYTGDTVKAKDLLKKAFTSVAEAASKSRGPAPTQIDESAVVARVAPAVKQQIEVESALTQLYADYPQIKQDEDFAQAAERARVRFEADGMTRSEAITAAGDATATKFGLQKSTTSTPDVTKRTTATTTKDQRKAAKEGLDEPSKASARATTQEPLPKTASSKIAEMAAARGQQF